LRERLEEANSSLAMLQDDLEANKVSDFFTHTHTHTLTHTHTHTHTLTHSHLHKAELEIEALRYHEAEERIGNLQRDCEAAALTLRVCED
jgi:hypothetical protein